jgi:hypothetical protein
VSPKSFVNESHENNNIEDLFNVALQTKVQPVVILAQKPQETHDDKLEQLKAVVLRKFKPVIDDI